MKQPELGRKLSEKRKENGLTQERLAEKTNINIRTIQRIESGDVLPRASTLCIILEALGMEMKDVNGNETNYIEIEEPDILKAAWVAGSIYALTVIILIPLVLFPIANRIPSVVHYITILHLSGIVLILLFDLGKIQIGKSCNNTLIFITAIIDIILFTLANTTAVLNIYMASPFFNIISRIIIYLLGINGLFFSIGIFTLNQYKRDLAIITGIVICVQWILLMTPINLFNLLGYIIVIPTVALEAYMMFWFHEKSQRNLSYSNKPIDLIIPS